MCLSYTITMILCKDKITIIFLFFFFVSDLLLWCCVNNLNFVYAVTRAKMTENISETLGQNKNEIKSEIWVNLISR